MKDKTRIFTINGIDYTEDEFKDIYYKVYGDNAGLDIEVEEYVQELNELAKKHNYSLEGLIIKDGVEDGSITFEENMIWSESLEKMVHSGFTIKDDDDIDKHYSWNEEDGLYYNDDTDEDYFMEVPRHHYGLTFDY